MLGMSNNYPVLSFTSLINNYTMFAFMFSQHMTSSHLVFLENDSG